MNINSLPKIKDSKVKIRKTFLITEHAAEVYVQAKNKLGIDTTKMCTDAIEKIMNDISKLMSKESI